MKHSLILVLILHVSSLWAQKESNLGKGIVNYVDEDSSFSVKMNTRFQSLYSSDFKINENGKLSENNTYFGVRRARLKFSGFAYSPKLTYKIELGLANDDIDGISEHTNHAPLLLLDAVAKWKFHGNFELWFGQTKLPGNRERLISSGSLQFVDRSLLNNQFNIDREAGFQLHHHLNLGHDFQLRETLALSLGEGRNITTGNIGGLNWTAKLEILPFGEFEKKGGYVGADIYREETPKLAFGFTYNYNDNAVKSRSNQGSYMITDHGYFETDITTFFADFMFKYRGFSMMGEYGKRESTFMQAVNFDGTPTGEIVNAGNAINLQAGYIFKNNYELALRYSNLEFEKLQSLNQDEYTLGVSKYIVGHNLKVQADCSYGTYSLNGDESLRYRLLFELQL